jgi:glutamate-1-semialdehyde 2,1-aminomutase
MVRWPGPFPLFVSSADGSTFRDVDGHQYVDFCLGDTGAMTGHGLVQVAEALSLAARRGITTMLPNDDGIWIAEELTRRFGLPKWQFAMTATDANRFVLRYARALTRRSKIAVIDWCYHGTVDETLVIRDLDGSTVSRPGALGPPIDPVHTTVSIPFNDLCELERMLSGNDIACLLMEPALTNIGIVLPDEGYLEEVTHSDVCFNYDRLWFESNGVTPPSSWRDLVLPEYEGLTVVSNPLTSSPGLAFLTSTVAAFGEDGFESFWQQLKDNEV